MQRLIIIIAVYRLGDIGAGIVDDDIALQIQKLDQCVFALVDIFKNKIRLVRRRACGRTAGIKSCRLRRVIKQSIFDTAQIILAHGYDKRRLQYYQHQNAN